MNMKIHPDRRQKIRYLVIYGFGLALFSYLLHGDVLRALVGVAGALTGLALAGRVFSK